jgi:hypothetical protein
VKSARKNAYRKIRADILAVLEKGEVTYSILNEGLSIDISRLEIASIRDVEFANPSLFLRRMSGLREPKMKPTL